MEKKPSLFTSESVYGLTLSKMAATGHCRELREFSQTRSRQQVEHLTQQLVDSARKLEEALVEKRELQSRIKKLEG